MIFVTVIRIIMVVGPKKSARCDSLRKSSVLERVSTLPV